MNKVVLMGRLTKHPDIRYTQTTDTMVSLFTLAVNKKFKKEGQAEADFINCVAWNKTAEFVSKYINKGQRVVVIGRLETRDYTNKKGNKVYITEVIAEEVYFADSKKENYSDI